MHSVEIIPSLPALSFLELSQKLERVRGLVSTFQIDVADGLFVTNRSWPMNRTDRAQFERLLTKKERLPYADEFSFEVHFMAHHPEHLLTEWVKIGIVRALFHIESQHDFGALVRQAETSGIELGAAIKLGTPIERLDAYIAELSVVQVMGIDPIGVQGQPFDPRALDVIGALRERFPDVTIAVDGAVHAESAPLVVSAGATRLAPGSFVLNSDNPTEALASLIHAL